MLGIDLFKPAGLGLISNWPSGPSSQHEAFKNDILNLLPTFMFGADDGVMVPWELQHGGVHVTAGVRLCAGHAHRRWNVQVVCSMGHDDRALWAQVNGVQIVPRWGV